MANSQPLPANVLKVRKRLRDNLPYYAKNALKIRTKAGSIEPLVLNKAQVILDDACDRQLRATGRIRIIILKGRQQGLSTYVGGRLYFRISQNHAKRGMVVTHHADSTKALFDMTKRYHENCPEALRPHTRYSSRRELVFDALNSSYGVATAGGESIGRSETITHLHASELAFWAPGSARENWNGLIQTVPDLPGTEVFIESTANGVTGLYYELWKSAVQGENGYEAVFIPWFLEDLYRTEPPPSFERTAEEQDLADRYGLDNAQLFWRRRKVAENGIDLFRQEYPCDPDEAFLTTGRPVFNPDHLLARLDCLEPVLSTMALDGDEFQENPRGELRIFAPFDPVESYYIGADVSMGVRDGDYSVAQVLDSRKRQVAVWRGFVHPDYFADILQALGRFYNEARIIVESNSHGILTCTRLGKDYAYPNFYTDVVLDKTTDRETVNLGFRTTVKTKPLILDQLRAALRENEITLNDPVTIREMLTYVVTETGAMEAERGCHDDCVMSLALVNHIHEGRFTPVEVTDDFYLEAI